MIHSLLISLVVELSAVTSAWMAPAEGERFINHGPAVPIAQQAWGGANAVMDSQGRALVLLPFILPYNALLVIDVESGKVEQFDVTEPSGPNYMRYHTLSSDGKRWYTTIGRSFRVFDIDQRRWSFVDEVPLQNISWQYDGRGYFEAEDGTLWIAFSPTSEFVSYDPVGKSFKNHGRLSNESWRMLPDGLAMDDQGWLYAAIVNYCGNLVAYNPRTGQKKQLIPEEEREHAAGQSLFRAKNGKVYAQLVTRADSPRAPGQWYELYGGEAKPISKPQSERVYYTRSGWKDPRVFPDGRLLSDYSLIRKEIEITDPKTGQTKVVHFDYKVEDGGANIYSIIEGPDGKIYGSTGTPLMFFRFDPGTGEYEQIGGLGDHGGHINALAELGGKIYGAVYSSGSLIEYDPEEPWDDTEIRESTNPKHLHGYGDAVQLYGRPFALFAHPDGKHLIMGGNPRRTIAGGGLLIYNVESGEQRVFTADQIVRHQATMVVKALENGDLIGGTTTAPGSGGGKRIAKEAVIYIMDWESREVVFSTVPIKGAQSILDLEVTEDGLVLGIAEGNGVHLFVFDPLAREVIYEKSLDAFGEPAGGQARRLLITSEDGSIYALFRNAIARINPETFEVERLATPPVTVGAGIIIVGDCLYFTDRVGDRGGPSLWSYRLPNGE